MGQTMGVEDVRKERNHMNASIFSLESPSVFVGSSFRRLSRSSCRSLSCLQRSFTIRSASSSRRIAMPLKLSDYREVRHRMCGRICMWRLTYLANARSLAWMGCRGPGGLSTSMFSSAEMEVFSTPRVMLATSRVFLISPIRFSIFFCRAMMSGIRWEAVAPELFLDNGRRRVNNRGDIIGGRRERRVSCTHDELMIWALDSRSWRSSCSERSSTRLGLAFGGFKNP